MTAISKHFRWTLAARGMAAIVFGLLVCTWPGIVLMTLLMLFGAYALIDGAFALVGSLVHRKALRDWWLVLVLALASMAVGVITFTRPDTTALVLLFFIAARAIVVGILEIIAAFEYRHEIRYEWLLAMGGALSVLFGVGVLAYPVTGAMAILALIGAYSILLGAVQVGFAVLAQPILHGIEERLTPA